MGRHASPKALLGQDDERLLAFAVAGNEAAFDALVARYRKPLLLYCTRLLPADRAEDVVQEAFLRTYALVHSGRRPKKLRPWLFQVAHNAAIDALRSRPPAAQELDPEYGGDLSLPDRVIESRHTTREVFAAVHQLPDRQRDAIVLRELEGRSYADIGRRLGTSGAAVRQLIVRARQSVRAAAAAFTPAGLIGRFPWLGNSVASHSAELSAGAGISAASAHVWVTALVTCTMGGSVVVLSKAGDEQPAAHRTAEAGAASASAEVVVAPLLGEAKEVTHATLLDVAGADTRATAPADTLAREPKQAPAQQEPASETAPAAPGCGPAAGPPAGAAKRKRARRSCDVGGPLAVGDIGPNDDPLEPGEEPPARVESSPAYDGPAQPPPSAGSSPDPDPLNLPPLAGEEPAGEPSTEDPDDPVNGPAEPEVGDAP